MHIALLIVTMHVVFCKHYRIDCINMNLKQSDVMYGHMWQNSAVCRCEICLVDTGSKGHIHVTCGLEKPWYTTTPPLTTSPPTTITTMNTSTPSHTSEATVDPNVEKQNRPKSAEQNPSKGMGYWNLIFYHTELCCTLSWK